MKKYLAFILLFAVIGLVIGYLIFGRMGGEYISVSSIFSAPDNILESVGQSLAGIKEIRQNILISGAVGAVAGLVLATLRK